MKQPIDLPIGSMVVGDSFFVPCVDETEVKDEARKIARIYKYRIRTESIVYNGLFGVRVWRIE